MNAVSIESNPFALLLDPELVFARISASQRLAMLNSRICRPLDKPLLGAEATDAEPADDAAGGGADEADRAS